MSVYPPEILSVVCSIVYSAALPTPSPSLDPLMLTDHGPPTALPSSMPPSNWPESVARRTLANLCLVNHTWYTAAKPWLWRRVEVQLPRSWLALVDEIACGEDEIVADQQAATAVDECIRGVASTAVSVLSSSDRAPPAELHQSVLDALSGPDGSIPPDLLTPPTTRDPSPRRVRTKSKSPARWKLMRSISDAVRTMLEHNNPGVYVPMPHDPHPGRYVRHLDFNHFRTIGMRRSVNEGVNSRFVTGERVEAVLKEVPNLTAFGATEYMDGALTLPVLKELLLRGTISRGRGRARGLSVALDPGDPEEEDRERRKECRQLEAVDLTGCVSAVFVNALTEFVNAYLSTPHTSDSDSSDDELLEQRNRRSSQQVQEGPLFFPGLLRLGLRGVKSIPTHVLTPFVLAFPSLTHLDLSGTRVAPELLPALGASDTISLHSLALARCIRITGSSIADFLIHARAAKDIKELSLYGDSTYPSPLSEDNLREIITHAPSFTSGQFTYLDLSSSPLTTALISLMAPQPQLRSLGLSYILNLPLAAITDFVATKAPNTEILTLISTSPELAQPGVVTPRQASMALHTKLVRPLCTPPFSFSLSQPSPPAQEPPTRVRVIELAMPLLTGLGGGVGAWRVVRSKGGRGWYVDTASGWVAIPGEGRGSMLRRDLRKDELLRREMERLADANGNVSSGVGWHARKMEVLHGHGMLGREDGLYGAVSFAYQGAVT